MTAILWLRHDLRLDDQPALDYAIRRGGSVLPVYIWAPHEEKPWPPGRFSRVWLHYSLLALRYELEKRGSRLIVRRGDSLEQLQQIAKDSGAEAVYWSRLYEPALRRRDNGIETALKQDGLEVRTFNASLLYEPWELKTKGGTPFQVYTPFWNAFTLFPGAAASMLAPTRFGTPKKWPESMKIEDLNLPSGCESNKLPQYWTPGEIGAIKVLKRFAEDATGKYEENRNFPGIQGTSRLSPHLHFGEIGPWRIRRTLDAAASASLPFRRQLVWREFSYHLLHHFSHTPEEPLRPAFRAFPWKDDNAALQAWKEGRTGYPFIDAAMRELRDTGWMHNRARMAAASFLVKHLLISWREGAAYFWDALADADLANNTMGWQWTAGCGADAAPYFRIFNPITQGEKFDSDGAYVRRWLPELERMPDQWIHLPWKAPASVLSQAGVVLDGNYPLPIIDHAAARIRALDAYQSINKK